MHKVGNKPLILTTQPKGDCEEVEPSPDPGLTTPSGKKMVWQPGQFFMTQEQPLASAIDWMMLCSPQIHASILTLNVMV